MEVTVNYSSGPVQKTLTFSNPRLIAEFSDWPSGGQRVNCVFRIEEKKNKGVRCSRMTTNKSGGWCNPKFTTYNYQMRIVDGSDGRTYIVANAFPYQMVKIIRSDFFDEGTIFDNNVEDFAKIKQLFA